MHLRTLYATFTAEAPRYVLARAVYLRALALVYAAAFASLGVQVRGLLGSKGITPAADHVQALRERLGPSGVLDVPTLFWLSASDAVLVGACVAGALLSAAVMVGLMPRWALLAQWVLYLSLMNVGGVFLGYQWDTLLLETGLLSVFLAPGGVLPERAGARAPRRWALVLLWFLLFRLMVMAGLVKLLSGDPTWRDLSALDYHYWTQPLPAWTSYWAHQLPPSLQRVSVGLTLLIEVAAPLLIPFVGRPRRIAAAALIALQVLILLTGNYGYFNYLSIALALLLVDDEVWRRLLPRRLTSWLSRGGQTRDEPLHRPVRVLGAVVACLLLVLAGWVAFGRLLRPVPPAPLAWVLQRLAPLHAVNAYGLFAVMTTTRPEIVVEGSADGHSWHAYEFRYKPGKQERAPIFVAPHQPRLDWQMWFAALGHCRQNPWFIAFQRRLLEGSPTVLALLEDNPFAQAPPRLVRSVVYQYRFTPPEERQRSGAVWTRTLQGPYCPTLTVVNGELRAVGLR